MVQNAIPGAEIVTWDPLHKKQVEEAKTLYRQAKSQGREILDAGGQPLPHWSNLGEMVLGLAAQGEHDLSVRIFDETGDRRLVWDSRDPEQILECETKFNEYLAKGWKAYAVDVKGKKGRRVYSFSAAREEVYFDDTKSLKASITSFLKEWGGMHLLPKTYPG